MRRYFTIPFQIGFVCIALCLFHLSLFDGLFAWLFPDEIYASNCYNHLGLLACSKSYYLTTTINRITAGFNVCLMAKIVSWFNTPYIGWVSARWIFYLCIPISMALFFQSILKIPLRLSFIIALMISAVGLFVMFAFPLRSADLTSFEDALFTPFGLDLASYATATFTFLMLFAL